LNERREIDAFRAGAAAEQLQRARLKEAFGLRFLGGLAARGVLGDLAGLEPAAWEAPFPSVIALGTAAQEQRARPFGVRNITPAAAAVASAATNSLPNACSEARGASAIGICAQLILQFDRQRRGRLIASERSSVARNACTSASADTDVTGKGDPFHCVTIASSVTTQCWNWLRSATKMAAH
jgi:hypothetical protein